MEVKFRLLCFFIVLAYCFSMQSENEEKNIEVHIHFYGDIVNTNLTINVVGEKTVSVESRSIMITNNFFNEKDGKSSTMKDSKKKSKSSSDSRKKIVFMIPQCQD